MFAVSVAAYVVVLVLVIAVAERVRAPGALPAALIAHRVVARRAVGPVAAAVTGAEAVLAVLLLVGLVRGPSAVVLAGAAVVFAGYGGYSWYVTASGRGGPCGCGGVEVPMGHWVTGRAFVLAALAVVAAAAADRIRPLASLDAQLLVVVLAAATIGILLWQLPAAARYPEVVR